MRVLADAITRNCPLSPSCHTLLSPSGNVIGIYIRNCNCNYMYLCMRLSFGKFEFDFGTSHGMKRGEQSGRGRVYFCGNLRRVKVIDNGMYLSGSVINGECFMITLLRNFQHILHSFPVPSPSVHTLSAPLDCLSVCLPVCLLVCLSVGLDRRR